MRTMGIWRYGGFGVSLRKLLKRRGDKKKISKEYFVLRSIDTESRDACRTGIPRFALYSGHIIHICRLEKI